MIGLTIVVPICMVLIGSLYLNDCPVEKYIPIYLIVGGKTEILLNVPQSEYLMYPRFLVKVLSDCSSSFLPLESAFNGC